MSQKDRKFPTQICRLCLSQTKIFYSLIENDEFAAMLEALTSLKILSSDEISTVMCLKCRLNLKLAFTIQQNMLKAEEKFRQLQIDSIKVEPIDEKLDEAEFSCEICGKIKDSQLSLARHKYNCHVKAKCPICGKEITQTNLKNHVDRHSSDRGVCELCGASVKKKDVKKHIKYTHSEGRYKCSFCSRPFKSTSNKQAHEKREHLNEANFVCDICGKKFYIKLYLRKHIQMTHEKLRPFICEFCKVGFSSKYALTTHRRKHTNETPYKCEVCGDGFRQKVSLKAHLKSKHKIVEELTEECKTCGKMFGSKAALISHSRLH